MDRSFYDLLGVQPGANRRTVDRAWAGRRAVAGPSERALLDEAHAVLADPLRAMRYAAYRSTPLSLDALASLELGGAPRAVAAPRGARGPASRGPAAFEPAGCGVARGAPAPFEAHRGDAPARDPAARPWALGAPPL